MLKTRLFGNRITLAFTVAGVASVATGVASILGYSLTPEGAKTIGEIILGAMLIFAQEN